VFRSGGAMKQRRAVSKYCTEGNGTRVDWMIVEGGKRENWVEERTDYISNESLI